MSTKLLLLICAIFPTLLRAASSHAPSPSLKVGKALALYCERYLANIRPDLSSYEDFLKLHEAAVEVSAKAHSNANQMMQADGNAYYKSYPEMDQYYGNQRYTVHLVDVESVLRRFDYLPKASLNARLLKLAARLHDTAEDTPIGIEHIAKWFGQDLANLVNAVKKVESSEDIDAAQAKILTVQKVLAHPLGTTLKLADRIANVEKGIREGGILLKYLKDHAMFRSTLYKSGENEKMWAYLDYLIQHQSFPSGRDYWSLRLEGLKYEILPKLETNAFKARAPAFQSPPVNAPQSLPLSAIHFMETQIPEHMDNFKYSVIETAHDLRLKQISPESFTPIQVWRDENGKIWTLDQRRFASFVLAGNVEKVPVAWASRLRVLREAFKFDPRNEGQEIQILLDDGRVVLTRYSQ